MTPEAAGPEDATRLAALHARCFERPWSADELSGMLCAEGGLALATAQGFVLARVVGPEAEILTVAVDPAARRSGLGRALLEAAVEAAAERGAEFLFLEVAADNVAALGLYRSMGFAPIGLRRGYYPRRDGPAADALTLRLSLPTPAS